METIDWIYGMACSFTQYKCIKHLIAGEATAQKHCITNKLQKEDHEQVHFVSRHYKTCTVSMLPQDLSGLKQQLYANRP
jgi:hypothetical protein